MTASAPPPPPNSRRPSLMATGSTTGKPATGDDDQGFSVSILSAASTGRPAEPLARNNRRQPSGKGRQAAWWLGVIAIGLVLFAVARWQQQAKQSARDAALLPVAAASAPVVAASAPASAVVVADAASEPASAPAADVVVAAAEAPSAPASAAPDSPPQRNPFEKFAEAAPAPRKVAQAAPTAKPATPAPAPRPITQPPRDRDAELVAALMANADAGREFQLPKAAPAPLSTAERNRFATELRQCQQKRGTNAARDACRAQACQTRGYAGRTKSCPATSAAPAPAHAPADAPASSPSGPTA